MVYSCMLVDGVKKLLESIFQRKYESDEKKYFIETQTARFLNIKEEDFLSDDKMFEYFRSLVFAHPYNTDRYFKKYFGTQVSPWVFVNKQFAGMFSGIRDAVGVRVYVGNKLNESQIRDVVLLEVSFKKLKGYINSRYKYLEDVIQWMRDEKFKIEENWKQEKINRCLEPIELIKELVNFMEKRYIENHAIKEFFYYLTCPTTNKKNNVNVQKYRTAIINKLPELCDAVDELNSDKIFDIVAELTKSPSKMHNGAGYQLEKIYMYLDENFEYEEPSIGSNEEWGRFQAGEFSKEFAKKWVDIDLTTMSNSEIKLLVAVACYLENQDQNKK